jgi:GNAT superfamily N-acetyltransferase
MHIGGAECDDAADRVEIYVPIVVAMGERLSPRVDDVLELSNVGWDLAGDDGAIAIATMTGGSAGRPPGRRGSLATRHKRRQTGAMSIRQAGRADVAALIETEVEAFYPDPVQRWLFPDDATRRAAMRRAYRHGMPKAIGRGAVWCTDDRLSFATWRRPDDPQPGLFMSLVRQVSLAPLLLKFGPSLRASLAAGRLLTQGRPAEPHWTLVTVATRPRVQGHGNATALIRDGLARCDQEGRPCFLTCNNIDHTDFYERFGFVVVQDIELPEGGPTLATMIRRVR